MKVYICKGESLTGYILRVVKDDGVIDDYKIDRTYPGEPTTLVLPENPSNRKYFSSKKVDNSEGEYVELTFKESRTLGPREGNSPRKSLVDYLTDEERTIYEELMAKAKARREEANKKPKLTEKEKIERAIEKYKRKLAELEA